MNRQIRRAIMSVLSTLKDEKGDTVQSLWHYSIGFCRDYGKPSRNLVKRILQNYVDANVIEVIDNKYYRLI